MARLSGDDRSREGAQTRCVKRENAMALAAKGFSTRQIAELTGWSHETIASDLRRQKSDDERQKSDKPSATGSEETKQHRALEVALPGSEALGKIIGYSLALDGYGISRSPRAMQLAMLFPEPEKGGRGKKSAVLNSAETAGFSTRRLNEARAVLRYSRELAEQVRATSPDRAGELWVGGRGQVGRGARQAARS
jgi:hypothetical protein